MEGYRILGTVTIDEYRELVKGKFEVESRCSYLEEENKRLKEVLDAYRKVFETR